MSNRRRSLAIVTGASAGIGRDLAACVAADGYTPLLVARREGRLAELASELDAAHGCGARWVAADLTTSEGVTSVIEAAGTECVEMLINNAGFGTFGPYVDTPRDQTDALVALNVAALTTLVSAFLPPMVERDSGYIMNVASIAGFMPGPMMTAYHASKAYVLSFSEALAEEVRGTGVHVSALCPGPTRTEFHAVAQMDNEPMLKRLWWMSSREVAELGYRGMKGGRPLVLPGTMNKLSAWLPRLVPRRLVTRIYTKIVSRPE